jgi:multidrug transporter EmrE-like cation transporter
VALLLGLVLCNIALQLVSAVLVKYSTGIPLTDWIALGLVLALILALNFSRFVVWGQMHKRYPLSVAYPATALFFPCLVVLAWAMGEQVRMPQVAGATLVTAGVLALVVYGGDAEA